MEEEVRQSGVAAKNEMPIGGILPLGSGKSLGGKIRFTGSSLFLVK